MFLLLKVHKNLILFLACTIISCSNEVSIHSYSGNALGTSFKILYTSNHPLKNIDVITDSIFFEINNSLSTYISNSDISKINDDIDSIKIDTHFKKVFNKSKVIWESTDGFFDPTIGLLVKAYGLGPKNDSKNPINIESIMNLTGFDKVSLRDNFIYKEKKGIYLDFNAIAKGYSVDVISNMLKSRNINNHLVEIGGEMVASGKNLVTNNFWRVGITDPLRPFSNNFIKKIELQNLALASSGNYRKYIIDKQTGKKIVHTINPKNGNAFNTNVLGVSVIAQDCITADAYATSFMAMPMDKSIEMISQLKNLEIMIIYNNEKSEVEIFSTDGFDKLVLK